MSLFLQNCLTFPVIIFSGLLIIVMFYWLCAAFGLLDIDLFNVDTSVDGGGFDATGFAGWLTKLGLAGIPVTIILTLFTLFGWLLSYFSVHWFIRFIDITLLRYLVGFTVFFVISFISIHLTALCLKPLREKLAKSNTPKTAQRLMGKLATVRSGEVTEHKGEAILEDGGAGLILQIRASATENIKRGDRVVIISYDPVSHSYNVVTEDEFRQ
ncbi:OB-fold-containig protein [Providencia stuartii]|uniref:OB-fold-containig protein n=1 Tax=Providencia stuartii TaxID=588 RepID=UPI000EF9075F|nr:MULTISPECIES: OB-fold-containig protein [Providencia]MBS7783415.1 NfeD family protein [Providencia thailandensis]RMA15300.1 ubiquinone biosynthesis protein UbiH [Providencia stuartii]